MSHITVMNRTIAYHQIAGDQNKPTVVFCGGYMSDMEGSKALFFENFCRENNLSYIRFDYSGHGASSEKFIDGTIGSWAEDCFGVIEQLTSGKLIIIGSSMGGWIGLLAALKFKTRLKGFIGIAAAPDFTRDLMWVGFNDRIKKQLQDTGIYLEPSEYSDEPYQISYKLITEGDDHMLLAAPIELECPVRLFHGSEDKDVPPAWAAKIEKALLSEDVIVTMVEGGDHRLSSAADLARYGAAVLELA